ncbi:hypothetical protein BH11MYX3_BH11MYX3_17720 [soil metagenome]
MPRTLRPLLLALAVLGACKTDEAAKAPPAPAAAPGSSATPAPAPVPAPPPPPTKSQQALAARAAVFSKLTITVKKSQDDCARLDAELAKLADDLRAAGKLTADIDKADEDQDISVTNSGLTAIANVASKCPSAPQVTAIMDIIAEISRARPR